MGLVSADAQPMSTSFGMEPPVTSDKKTNRSTGRSISFAEDFIYDPDKQDAANTTGIGFKQPAAASRRRTQPTQLHDESSSNTTAAEYGVDNMLPPPLPLQRRGISKSLAVGAVPFRNPSASFPVPHGSFADKDNNNSEYSMTMPLSPASIALKKLRTKLNAHRKRDNVELDERDRFT